MLYTRSVAILAQAILEQGPAGHESHCGSGVLLYSVQWIHRCRRHLRRLEELVSRPTLRGVEELVSRPTLQQKQNKEKQNHCAALKWNVRERSALVAELSSSTTATAAAARAAVANLLLQRSLFRYTLEPRSREDGKFSSRR